MEKADSLIIFVVLAGIAGLLGYSVRAVAVQFVSELEDKTRTEKIAGFMVVAKNNIRGALRMQRKVTRPDRIGT